MLSYFHQAISLNNLRRHKASGQIATLLILVMVMVLVLILVTVNIGQLSLTTTNLANTVDSTCLYLASQLGTRSQLLSQALGYRVKICKRCGVLGIIGGIIGVILAPFTFGTSLWSFVGMGAAGGAIGGTISGVGPLQGAIQGASIGLAVAGGFGVLGSITEGVYAWAGAVGLTAATSLYNANVANQMTKRQMSAACEGLNGLETEDYIRESVFLMALSQTVDDPNTTGDTFDVDGDGDTGEKILAFQDWWFKRTSNVNALKTLISNFFNGKMKTFTDFAKTQYAPGGALARDGVVARLASALEDINTGSWPFNNQLYNINFWKPGISSFNSQDDESVPLDAMDWVVINFQEIVETAGALQNTSLDEVTANWKGWIRVFYRSAEAEAGVDDSTIADDPDEEDVDVVPVGYDERLQELLEGSDDIAFPGLTAWREDIIKKWGELSDCEYGPCDKAKKGPPEQICNPPCRFNSSPYAGTIDESDDDEFSPAIAAIERIIAEIAAFRVAIQEFYAAMQEAAQHTGVDTTFGGKNPITYTWKDSRGEYSVKVETQFTVPKIETIKRGPKLNRQICIRIRGYKGRPTVEITRSEPTNRPVGKRGILGKWNPFSGRIVRKSIGYYTCDIKVPRIFGFPIPGLKDKPAKVGISGIYDRK